MVEYTHPSEMSFEGSTTQEFEGLLEQLAPLFHGVRAIHPKKIIKRGKSGASVILVEAVALKHEEQAANLIAAITKSLDYAQLSQLRTLVMGETEAPTLDSGIPSTFENHVENFVNRVPPERYEVLVNAFTNVMGSERGYNKRKFISRLLDQPYYLKIYNDKEQAAVFHHLQEARDQAKIYQLMRPAVDHASIAGRLLVLYIPANDSIDPDKVMSLGDMTRRDYARAEMNIGLVARTLQECYSGAQVTSSRNPHDVLKHILRPRRVDIPGRNVQARTIELLNLMNVSGDTVARLLKSRRFDVPGVGRILPNPVAYLDNPDWWQDAQAIVMPEDYVHGDLHCENLICRTDVTDEKSEPPELIDFDDPSDGKQSIFFDYLYLELDIILKLLPPDVLENRESILRLLDLLMQKVHPAETDQPLDANGISVFRLVRPLRAACRGLIADSHAADAENAFWLTAVAVGLNYLRKTSGNTVEPRQQYQRLLGWMYAAYALERALRLHEIVFDRGDTLTILWTDDNGIEIPPPPEDLGQYLQALTDQLGTINLAQLSDRISQAGPVQLKDVFVPLYTNVQLVVDSWQHILKDWNFKQDAGAVDHLLGGGKPIARSSRSAMGLLEGELLQNWEGVYLQRICNEQHSPDVYIKPLDARVAAALAPHLVIIGEPGSGKSTILRYIALCLAGDLLGGKSSQNRLTKRNLPFWPHEALTPVYVELSALVRFAYSDIRRAIGDVNSFAYEWIKFLGTQPTHNRPEFANSLHDALVGGTALLLIDGVDEVADFDRPERQEQITTIVSRLRELYKDARIIIGTRPYGRNARANFEGFVDVRLIRLEPDETAQLAKHLFSAALVEKDIEAELGKFQGWVNNVPEEIRTNPLFFSLIIAIWLNPENRSKAQPTTKGAIYRAAVETLLKRWARPGTGAGRSRLESIGLDEHQLRKLLEALAYRIHSETRESSEAAMFESGMLMTTLRRDPDYRRDGTVNYDVLIESLGKQSGLIQDRGNEFLKFTHLSFQEHLSARYLSKPGRYPLEIVQNIVANPLQWRNVIELLPDELEMAGLDPWELVEELLPQKEDTLYEEDSTRWYGVYYALNLLENDKRPIAIRMREQMRDQLRSILQQMVTKGALSPEDRLKMAELLAAYGDRRPGVGLERGQDGTEVNVPDIVWCDVPAGIIHLGRPGGKYGYTAVSVESFRISKYPITLKQFEAFVKDGGYETAAYWQAGRDEHRESEAKYHRDLENREHMLANHPVVGVSWFEALAFCEWLSERLGLKVRLPLESQWEMAARGTDGRLFPTGDSFESHQGNVYETGLRRTTPVGMFPAGASPFEVMDMVGNVQEWTRSKWRDSFSLPEIKAVYGENLLVLRGGNFFESILNMDEIPRTQSLTLNPLDTFSIGFRVVVETPGKESTSEQTTMRTVTATVSRVDITTTDAKRRTRPIGFDAAKNTDSSEH